MTLPTSSDAELDALLNAPLDIRDPKVQPDGVVCSCGRIVHWSWWGGRGPIPGRWCRPASDPCDACKADREAHEQREELRRRLGRQGAQLPQRHAGYTWARTLTQRSDEDLGEWVRRVRDLEPRTIGIRHGQQDEAAKIARWEPAHGGLYVHGPVGTGKSLMVAARLRDLLSEVSVSGQSSVTAADLVTGVVCRVDDARKTALAQYGARQAQALVEMRRHVRIRPGGIVTRALWVDESELVERVSLGWAGDRAPLKQVSDVPLLVLDDLGAVAMTHKTNKRAQLVRDSVARLVAYRWERELVTIYTSNLPPHALRDVYGERTADRLAQSVASAAVLGGMGQDTSGAAYSWRKPPPARPFERSDRKTQAAEPKQHREPVQERLM